MRSNDGQSHGTDPDLAIGYTDRVVAEGGWQAATAVRPYGSANSLSGLVIVGHRLVFVLFDRLCLRYERNAVTRKLARDTGRDTSRIILVSPGTPMANLIQRTLDAGKRKADLQDFTATVQ